MLVHETLAIALESGCDIADHILYDNWASMDHDKPTVSCFFRVGAQENHTHRPPTNKHDAYRSSEHAMQHWRIQITNDKKNIYLLFKKMINDFYAL